MFLLSFHGRCFDIGAVPLSPRMIPVGHGPGRLHVDQAADLAFLHLRSFCEHCRGTRGLTVSAVASRDHRVVGWDDILRSGLRLRSLLLYSLPKNWDPLAPLKVVDALEFVVSMRITLIFSPSAGS
jgi:hypothetical protein